MATLEKIRKRSGLLIVVIGIAMMGFVLGDFFSNGSILFNDPNKMGSINGEKIKRQEFSLRIDKLRNSNPQYANYSEKTLADFVWSQMEMEIIQGEEYDKLGIMVTPEELYYDVKNNQEIKQAFTDPNTGTFSEAAFSNYLNQLQEGVDNGNPEAITAWKQWTDYEDAIKQNTLNFKYNTAVQYGIYFPSVLAEEEFKKSNMNVQGDFIQLPYESVADSTVEPSESELSSYYSKHKSEYEQEASRDFEFVSFEIKASEEDKKEVYDELVSILDDRVEYNKTTGVYDTIRGFKNSEDDSTFVLSYSSNPFDDRYYKEGDLPPNIDSIIFNNEVGFVYGPYEDGNGYNLLKINKSTELPDSVKARHILIAYAGATRAGENVTRTGFEAKTMADSLFALIKEDPTQFESISSQNSDDVVARGKGGDLGWFNDRVMAQPFTKYCFRHDEGDIGLIQTEFGFHIIVIDEQEGSNKAYRLASIRREVRPSQNTIEEIYREASMFASDAKNNEDYGSIAEQKGYSLRPVTGIKKSDEVIPGLSQNRQIVQWTFEEDRVEGDINVFSTNTAHIVVVLTDIFEDGVQPLDKVRDQIRTEVIKEKKADLLIEKFNNANGSTIQEIAAAVGAEVKPQATSFASSAISGIGNEPKVVGTMIGLDPGKISEPIVGERGVYVVASRELLPYSGKQDYSEEKTQLKNNVRNLVASQLFDALKNDADIEDIHNDIY